MSGVKKLGSDEFLTFKDGTIVDETLFDNEPLESTYKSVQDMPEETKKAMFESLFQNIPYPSDK